MDSIKARILWTSEDNKPMAENVELSYCFSVNKPEPVVYLLPTGDYADYDILINLGKQTPHYGVRDGYITVIE